MIGRLCVVGVGLIGGSLALALRRAGAVGEVVGVSRNRDHLQRARELGVIDRYELEVERAIGGADVVVLAVPLGAIEGICRAMHGHLASDTVLTDVGSAKGSVVASVERAFGALPAGFVPGHPIAGTERSGVEAAFADLFEGRRVILTPVPTSVPAAIGAVTRMWEATGAIVESMSVGYHDQVLAATSHLPHMLAFGLVDAVAAMGEHDDIFCYAAGGFRDFTRIASSDPVMWRDICLANSEALLSVLRRFRDELHGIETAIERRDGEALMEIFGRAKQARDRLYMGE